MNNNRLQQQIQFILEIDKLKTILRRSYITTGKRRENSAEHSWHVAMLALILAEHADTPIDVLRVLKMMLIHDIVEIDAGDTFIYDEAAVAGQAEREAQAAERLFGLLPDDQRHELRALWEEFDARLTADARFAGALDRLMPLLHAYNVEGRSWKEGGAKREQIMQRNATIEDGSAELWRFAKELLAEAVAKGYMPA